MASLWWVVDACVLYEVSKGNLQAFDFLLALLKRHGLALDQGWIIQGQYTPVLYRDAFLKSWFTHLNDTPGKIQWFASDVSSRHRKQLVQSLGFHDDDLVYIGVALRTPDKLVVSEDREPGDFDDPVCQYLEQNFSISVLCIAEACEKA